MPRSQSSCTTTSSSSGMWEDYTPTGYSGSRLSSSAKKEIASKQSKKENVKNLKVIIEENPVDWSKTIIKKVPEIPLTVESTSYRPPGYSGHVQNMQQNSVGKSYTGVATNSIESAKRARESPPLSPTKLNVDTFVKRHSSPRQERLSPKGTSSSKLRLFSRSYPWLRWASTK